ncbi:hypothetical protein GS682_27600 [Nostoc sp. B(2019)]|nr:hypothetical protein [Nostoc sp. B(2019)]
MKIEKQVYQISCHFCGYDIDAHLGHGSRDVYDWLRLRSNSYFNYAIPEKSSVGKGRWILRR